MASGFVRYSICLTIALLCLAARPVFAMAETRTLKLFYVHTNERAEVTYKRNGKYLSEGLKKANYMLRDWRRNEPTKMDPKTLDILWQVYKASGSRDYIHVVSGYRSPATNTMLRRTRGGQAEKSQHLLGKAIDFYLPDVKLSKLRAIAFKIQGGGVGYYPKSGSPFVHVDSGNVRAWPRMSRKELLALFPDGKTVHLPADGKPLPGYQAALAAYKNNKGAANTIVADDAAPEKKQNLWASLFGGGADESDDEADVTVVASAAPKPAKPQPVAPKAVVPQAPVPQSVDIAALQPNALDGGPDASGSGFVAAPPVVPPLEAIEQAAPEFTALPARNAPLPSAAPRIAEPQAPAEEALVAVVEPPVQTPLDAEAVKAAQALAEAEIAAIDGAAGSSLPLDGPVPSPRPVAAIAASGSEPAGQSLGGENVDIASLSADPQTGLQRDELRAAFAPAPETAPAREDAASLEPLTLEDLTAEEAGVEIAALPDEGPIPQWRNDELSATPEPVTPEPVASEPAAPSTTSSATAKGAIGVNLKTGVKTTAKTAKIAFASIGSAKGSAKTAGKSPAQTADAAVPFPVVLPPNTDRFGPAPVLNDASTLRKLEGNEQDLSSTASLKKSPRILPDGSTLISSGKIAP